MINRGSCFEYARQRACAILGSAYSQPRSNLFALGLLPIDELQVHQLLPDTAFRQCSGTESSHLTAWQGGVGVWHGSLLSRLQTFGLRIAALLADEHGKLHSIRLARKAPLHRRTALSGTAREVRAGLWLHLAVLSISIRWSTSLRRNTQGENVTLLQLILGAV